MHGTAEPATGLAPILDHFDGRRFFNPHAPEGKSLREVRRWQRTRQKEPWPERVEDPIFSAPGRVAPDRISATFIGHSTFLLQVGGVCVLTDPIWSERCSPVPFAGPRRVRRPGQRLSALPAVELVLVSHNHYDHMDLPTLRQVQARWAPQAATGLGNGRLLAKAGMGSAAELDWWQSLEFGGARMTYVPAQHFSSRGLHDRNRCLWGGFVIEAQGAVVYFAGDSGYCPHFAEIGRRFPRIDLALLQHSIQKRPLSGRQVEQWSEFLPAFGRDAFDPACRASEGIEIPIMQAHGQLAGDVADLARDRVG